ncbi:MAG: hypothetical protein V1897_07710, partial [Pseudomonadota bacterium]
MSNSKQDIEDQKQKLIEHLISEVADGISGRDHAEVFDASPSRVLFAGVLQPSRRNDEAKLEIGGNVPPANTSLGLDFKVRPKNVTSIRLTIAPRWSLYYPIFPSLSQTIFANKNVQSVDKLDQQPPLLTKETMSEEDVESLEVDEDESSDLKDEEPKENLIKSKHGSVLLPRVFWRHDVIVEPIVLDVPLTPNTQIVGGKEIQAALEKARKEIQADTSLWKHLSKPSDAKRDLGDASVLITGESYQKSLDEQGKTLFVLPPWAASIKVDITPELNAENTLKISVLISNTTITAAPDEKIDWNLEERSIFDTQMTIEIGGGDLQPLDFFLAPEDYRCKPQMPARGVNCTAKWSVEKPNLLRTETLPVFKQPYYRTKESFEVPFANLDTDNPTIELERIAQEMDVYLKSWSKFLLEEKSATWGQHELDACSRDRDEFSKEIENYRLGIETLRRDPKLVEAFRLMNRAFAKLARSSEGRVKAWRLFQIGFIVSQLPSLAVRELDSSAMDNYSQTLRSLLNEVGVLWFPTGGGKTESYLGLIATALVYDRLRGKNSGVCAWMRFPLRMLSLQQLERLAKVIAVLNEMRSECPRISSGDPFAIGYYVGESVTPNSINKDKMRELETNISARENLRLIRKCPFCGGAVNIEVIRSSWRVAHVCANSQCFSNTSESLGFYKGSLPLCVVDSEIYRYLPSVLVGTVDKLAIIARNQHFAQIIRGAHQKCPIHGYTSYNKCIVEGNWGANCSKTKRDLLKVPLFKDPGISLLIQDELHLLRAELGVFNGHYEGLLRYLGEKTYMRPKILAATATIEAY